MVRRRRRIVTARGLQISEDNTMDYTPHILRDENGKKISDRNTRKWDRNKAFAANKALHSHRSKRKDGE
jgi:hypothetical protein